MDKPISMSIKDYLIRTLAVKLRTSEKTIEQVINHQFQSANEAMDLNDSLEISGFGKLLFNKKKAIKKLENWEAKMASAQKILATQELSEQRRKSLNVALEKTRITYDILKAKITYED